MELLDVYKSLNRQDLERILSQLEPIEKGDKLSLICPQCGQRTAFTYLNQESFSIICNRRNNCKYKATYLQFVAGERHPRGENFKKALSILTGTRNFTNFSLNTKKELKKTFTFFKEKKEYSKEYSKLIPLKESNAAINYLKSRGISPDLAEQKGAKVAPYGFWPNFNSKGKLIRQWKPGRLVFPILDFYNRDSIMNLYGRTIEWKNFKPFKKKIYKSFRHDQLCGQKGLFNFHPSTSSQQNCLIFVEGVFDALSLIQGQPKYQDKVIGTFGANSFKWELFPALKSILFAFDPDEAGQNHPLIKEAVKQKKNVYILDKAFYQGLDLNEYWIKFHQFKNFRKNIIRIS